MFWIILIIVPIIIYVIIIKRHKPTYGKLKWWMSKHKLITSVLFRVLLHIMTCGPCSLPYGGQHM